jgi:two-component system cell cycle sensor histidine kinase/response regulator CckA
MSAKGLGSTAVVVAGDQDKVREVVSATLGKVGFQVLTAPTGAVALSRCRESHDPVGLMVVDTPLPGMNLSDFLSQLRDVCPAVRILFLADFLGNEAGGKPQSRQLGTLRKPFRRSQLVGSVLELMERPVALTA